MSLTVIPTQVDGSLGRTKVDATSVPNLDEFGDAAEHNVLVQAVAELTAAQGLGDGTTEGSIQARLLLVGSPLTGALLWKWDGLTTDQFDATAIDLQSGDGSSTMSLSVVDLGGKLGKVLRITYATTDGGGIFLVKSTELVLPSRYVMSCRHMGRAGAGLLNIFGGAVPWSDASANAMLIERPTTNNLTSTTLAAGTVIDQAALATSGTFNNPATVIRQGIYQLITCDRQAGDNPSDFVVAVEERRGEGGISYDANDRAVDHSVLGAQWNSLDLARFGIGGWVNVLNVIGTLDLKSLAIYAHPED